MFAMAQLSPNQRAKLETLWKSMPDHMRAALHESARMAADSDPASQRLVDVFTELEESFSEPAGDKARPYLFAPLRPLTAEPGTTMPSQARFTPEEISKMWGWMGRRLCRDVLEAARKCRKPETDALWHEFRRSAAEKLEEALHNADRVPKDMTALVKRFGADGRDMLSDAVILLKSSEELDNALRQIPPRLDELDEDMAHKIKKVHEQLVETVPEAAVWLLIMTMGRLNQPWQIFRVIAKIGRREDDLVVSKTELAAVGDAFLSDTGSLASSLANPPADLAEAKQMWDIFDNYVAYSTGITAEFGIRKDGRWGQSLFGLRAEASTNVEKILQKVPLALDSGLPEPRRGRSGRIIPAQLPNDAAIDRAEGLLFFLQASREHANAAAITSTQKRIMEEMTSRMQDAGELLVDLVADSEGQNRETARSGLEITARLMDAAGLAEESATLRRRGTAAAA